MIVCLVKNARKRCAQKDIQKKNWKIMVIQKLTIKYQFKECENRQKCTVRQLEEIGQLASAIRKNKVHFKDYS